MKNENQDTPPISEPLRAGSILVSSPLLRDPSFQRSVILILDKDESDGYIGLILNRRLDLTIHDVCEVTGKVGDMHIFNGGPVDLQRLFWLHSFGNNISGSKEIIPGIYVGGDYDEMVESLHNDPEPKEDIRFILGYSGWSAGQLEKEIEAGAWSVVNNTLDPHSVLDYTGDEMWHHFAKSLDDRHRHWQILPSDPNMN